MKLSFLNQSTINRKLGRQTYPSQMAKKGIWETVSYNSHSVLPGFGQLGSWKWTGRSEEN